LSLSPRPTSCHTANARASSCAPCRPSHRPPGHALACLSFVLVVHRVAGGVQHRLNRPRPLPDSPRPATLNAVRAEGSSGYRSPAVLLPVVGAGVGFEHELHRRHITQKNGRPNHPRPVRRHSQPRPRRPDRHQRRGHLAPRWGLHHISAGRTYARTHVLLLVQDLDVRVINAATGELVRELTLDPDRNYQPTGRPRRPKKKTP